MQPEEFEFGRFRFDRATGLLFAGADPISLGRRGAALLDLLLARRGKVLTKAELIDAAWGDAAIEESNLSVQIAALRQMIGKAPDGREWIATVPRIGYRFIPADAAAKAETSVHSSLPVLQVRPFAERGDAHQPDTFAAVFHDDMIAALSRFGSFAVSGGGGFGGMRADVRYVLEGSIRRSSGDLSVHVHLVDATSGLYVWSNRFDGGTGDIEGMHNDIVERVAAVVELQIQLAEIERSRRERPRSMAAYDLYLRAQFYLGTSTPEDNATAFGLFSDALELDPDNVLYLAGAAEAIQCRIAMGWDQYGADDRKASRDIAFRGLRRARDADAGSLSLFGMSLFNGGETDFGYATIQRATELNPNSIMACLGAGHVNLHWGKLEDSEAHLRRAYRLNPLDPLQRFVLSALARIRLAEGRFEEALRLSGRAMGVNSNLGHTHWALIAASANLGRLDESAARLARFQERHPGVTIADIKAGQPYRDNRSASMFEGLELAGLPAR